MDDTRPPDETGTGNTPTDSWLELLQYAHASAHGHPHPKRAGDDPWPQRPRPRTHRIRRDAPERDWRPRPNTAAGHTRFDSDDWHLHCGFGIRGTRAVTTETDYLETHTSPYLPEITATGHGWLETRTTPGEPPVRPGPWLYALGRMLREMHQIEARKPLPYGVPLTALQRVCGHETARLARRLLVPARRHPHVITHGDLHPGNITTRNGRHLLTVTGFDTVAAGAAERDTVAALLGLAPHTGIATLATVIRPAADPALLRDELLRTLDRLATHVGNRDPASPTRRRTLHHLTSTLTNHPEIADELSERLTGTPN
jgi:hypothetical protein